MATSAKKIVVKESVNESVKADKVSAAAQAPALKKTTTKKQGKSGASAVKTVLSPIAAWPFPTGSRP